MTDITDPPAPPASPLPASPPASPQPESPTESPPERGRMREHCVMVYTRFNRLWHWSQATSIIILIFTGLRIMGMHALIPYGPAVMIHTLTALALLLLWAFATFWLFTTGQWRQYLPTGAGLWEVMKFYAWGVFHGEHHPYRKVFTRKHNPLQAVSYLVLKTVLFPAVWSTGIVYLLHGLWQGWDRGGFWLNIVANLHILAGFAVFTFVVIHLYLLTIGHGFLAHVRPMITGFDRIALTPEEEAYLRQDEPQRLQD